MILRPSYRRYQSSIQFFPCVLLFDDEPISLTHPILRRPKEDYLKFSPSLFTCISYSSGPLDKEYGTKIPPFLPHALLHVGFQVQAKTVAPKSCTMWSHFSPGRVKKFQTSMHYAPPLGNERRLQLCLKNLSNYGLILWFISSMI
jgi:hypothetical protein